MQPIAALVAGAELSLYTVLMGFTILLIIAMAATLIVLIMGVVGMIHQGPFNSRWSNKLMRLRVLFQFAAILLLGLAFLVGPQG